MNNLSLLAAVAVGVALAACTPVGDNAAGAPAAAQQEIITLDEDLKQLIADFNDMSDKMRLVFIGGPACGVCLRGMDDLNRSIVASVQSDARVHTFMIDVPALGSTIEHATQAIQLMPGPRVTHYWDDAGTSGIKFQEALDIWMYAWDVWMIYEPGATWDGDLPPPPAHWEHQLPSLPSANKLDADRFASEVRSRLAGLGGNRRKVRNGASDNGAALDGTMPLLHGETNGFSQPFLEEYLASHDLNVWMTDWKDEGNSLSRHFNDLRTPPPFRSRPRTCVLGPEEKSWNRVPSFADRSLLPFILNSLVYAPGIDSAFAICIADV